GDVVAVAVNFEVVDRAALGDLAATWVVVVEVHFRSAGAIEALGEDARDGGLAGPSRSAEQVRVRDAVLLDGMSERAGDVLLPDHIAEALRPVFACDDLVRHERLKPVPGRFRHARRAWRILDRKSLIVNQKVPG